MASTSRAQLLDTLIGRGAYSEIRLAQQLEAPLFDVRYYLWRMHEDGLVYRIFDEGEAFWGLQDGALERHRAIEADRLVISDGFGSTWVRCRLGNECGLHVVRPGKADCYYPRCPE